MLGEIAGVENCQSKSKKGLAFSALDTSPRFIINYLFSEEVYYKVSIYYRSRLNGKENPFL